MVSFMVIVNGSGGGGNDVGFTEILRGVPGVLSPLLRLRRSHPALEWNG